MRLSRIKSLNLENNSEYFNKEKSHLISFIPQRCIGLICGVALDNEIDRLSASHVFIENLAQLATKKELYSVGQGITYRRD